jgi:hypothetical protein
MNTDQVTSVCRVAGRHRRVMPPLSWSRVSAESPEDAPFPNDSLRIPEIQRLRCGWGSPLRTALKIGIPSVEFARRLPHRGPIQAARENVAHPGGCILHLI